MIFDTPVVEGLGADRALAVTRATELLLQLADSVPEATSAVVHLPLTLVSETGADAVDELTKRLEGDSPGLHWVFATALNPDGSYLAKASPFLRATCSGPPGTNAWFIRFLFSDLHTRLSAWWLTQLWRAAELATSATDTLAGWQIIAASACSRSLLEGAAAFAVAVRGLSTDWDTFKRSGEPTLDSLTAFTTTFNDRLARLQFASRVGQGKGKPPNLLSTNVLTQINKLASETLDRDVLEIYDWLSDTVHPSFGSGTAYLTFMGHDKPRTHLLMRYARQPLRALADADFAIRPTVACAAADAIVIASQTLLRDLAEVRWLIDDLGFTSRAAFCLELDYFGSVPLPKPNAPCPCGSGKKFKKCVHRWGCAGRPPQLPAPTD